MLNKVRQKLKEAGIDALLSYDPLNQRYLTGFSFTDGAVLITKEKAYLVTDFRYIEAASNVISEEIEALIPSDRNAFFEEVFTSQGIKTVGFEGGFLPYGDYKRHVERFDKVEFVDANGIVESVRQIKTEKEIALMQKAQDIADGAFTHILGMINPSMTEIDVASELEYYMRRAGAEAFSFETIAVSGDASALPHGVPRNVKLKRGFLTMDFGAKYEGYCSDMTRTIVIGKADEEMKKLYNTVLRAQLAALDFIREGVDCKETDRVARDIIDSYPEYKGKFGHSLGHSIGLFVHESPAFSPRSDHKTRCGEIYSVEPGIYLAGKYGCRIEDMVAIREDGVYNFTHSTKELIEIL